MARAAPPPVRAGRGGGVPGGSPRRLVGVESRPETVEGAAEHTGTGVAADLPHDADTAGKAASRAHPLRAFRERIGRRPVLALCYRVAVAVVGTTVLVVGVIAIPFPGPGWAMVFAGIGILATEFAFARAALVWLRDKYRRGMAWYIARGPVMQVLAFLGTCAVVLATLWVVGTFELVGGWIGVEWRWLRSPLMS